MQTIEDLGAELRNAAKEGNVEIAGMILSRPEVNAKALKAKDKQGCTALIIAVEEGKTEVVKAILDHKKCDSTILPLPGTALQRSSLFSRVSGNRVGITLGFMGVLAAVTARRCQYSP